ncbi:S41 family peptidase [Deinococcus misasensis]|uniref:S41 family peptidase n=1 Tax=Deinococcus misasensis TaxID=392413 RepID=UPI00068FC749|nr:S41 family peptidase [Deinococcus misasensis]
MPSLITETLSRAERLQTLSELSVQFRDQYVYPETGQLLFDTLQEWSLLEPETASPATEWCTSLTQRLRTLVPDKHLRVFAQVTQNVPEPAVHAGVQRVEHLEQGIALLELNAFSGLEQARPLLDAAMALVKPARALIVDLRKNGGGSGETVTYLCSFLLEPDLHLQSFYRRNTPEQSKTHTLQDIPYRDLEKPVVVLTSQRTASAAEECAYNLQAAGRATLIGETTAGAAHTVDIISLNEKVGAFIPSGHPISPYTGGHWERTGVQPDLAVPADEALTVALEHLKVKTARGVQ